MTSKQELLKRLKEERIAREKARIQMLHDMNRKKYNKNDDNAWKYSKSNGSLNTSDDKSPVKNAMYNRGPSFVMTANGQTKRQRAKNNSLLSLGENCLNVSAPVNSNTSFSKDSVPKRRSMYSATEHNAPIEFGSPTSTSDVTN